VSLKGGKTAQITVPVRLLERVGGMVHNYAELWAALEEISEINRELLRKRLLESNPHAQPPSLSDPSKSLAVNRLGLTEELLKGLDEHLAGDADRSEFPDLLSFEEWAGELTRQLGQAMIGRFLAMRARQTRQTLCPHCGQAMQRHKRSAWNRQTLWGEVWVEEDVYFCCRDCHTSARPLRSSLGTERETWSLLVQEAAVDFTTDESCQKAVEKLARHHPGVEMNRTTALRFLHQHGTLARDFVSHKLRQALVKAAGESRRHRGAVELEVEYDGGMVPVATLHPILVRPGEAAETTPVRGLPKRKKECGWEEVKVGLVQVPGEVSRKPPSTTRETTGFAVPSSISIETRMRWLMANIVNTDGQPPAAKWRVPTATWFRCV